ncbi:outer membrane protein/protease secretion system outer membrane protein [Tepidimonas ignava]|uniref:Outer membrane protein TolC n=1 Tax=Tepidimonas ignava TaxID=114249 RepID=A0A4R3LDS5_9BURK|nr:TolC family outer membrane protein [Tepidimonas ignava]TCS97515.1 outer membrane protein/protease secretion system outer membrane protein [Tepidimonas ignava]TSE22092.1 Outer membrane protein TolC [Tepidimonas ignava]
MAVGGWAHALDLDQAYRLAQSNDARVRATRAATDAQRERLPQAESQRLPQVSLSGSRSNNDLTRTSQNFLGQPVTVDERYWSYNATLGVRVPLYRPAVTAGIAVAKAQVADAEAVLRAEEINLAARVAQAYFEALTAQDNIELVAAQQRAATTQADAARKAWQAGTGTRTDVDEIEARLDLLRADEVRARQQLEYAMAQMQVLVGPWDGALAPVDAQRFAVAPLQLATLTQWLELAERNSPELAALRARRDAAQQEIARASAGHWPTLDAVVQITRSASENVTSPSSSYTNRAVGVQLNVPLYSGGYTSSTVRQAMAELVRAEEQLEAARRDLHLRIHDQYRLVIEGSQRISALQKALASAQQVVQSNRQSWLAGVRTILDVLDAEVRALTVERDLRAARYQYLLARLRLAVLAGASVDEELGTVQAMLSTGPRAAATAQTVTTNPN